MKTRQDKDADSMGMLSLQKDKTNPPCPPFQGKGGYDGEGIVGMVRYLYNEGAFSHYQHLYYLYDTLGSVAQVTAENGLALQEYLYTPYGEAYNTAADSVNGLRFVGRYGGYTDDDTRLTYFWHRWYDSADGRWVSRDPIEGIVNRHSCSKRAFGIVNISNSYHYVSNNPRRWRDDVGLMGEDADAGSNNANVRGNIDGRGIEARYNYCGKNYSNGQMHISWRDENSFEKDALNPTDACCKGHDLCSHYVLNQMYNGKLAPCEYRTKTITDCNRDLANCFSKNRDLYSRLGYLYFGKINKRVGDPANAKY